MQIARTAPNEITITGNIKSTEDYLDIRNMVTELVNQSVPSITLRIQESMSMPSSVIGFFVKLVNRDKVPMTMLIQDKRLLELLQELGLEKPFGARQA